ncbi:MAG: pilus assembly protein PilM, partial [Deltaproteobacteria bacterium]|nr:pilus assembly protein PilM [Deltaproteobacteria bacterium]
LSRGFRGLYRLVGARRVEIPETGGIPEALSQLFAEPTFCGAICVTALSPGLLSFRNLRLPFRDDKRIAQTLAFSLEPLIQQPIDELQIDYTVTGRTEQSEIFAALADRKLVAERVELLSPCVRDTAVIDIAAVPLTSRLMQAPDFPACALVLDIGVRETTAIFAGKGRILHIRDFGFGGETATAAIAGALGIERAEAEAAKLCGELPEAAMAAVRAVGDRFLAELSNTQAFLLDQGGIPEPPARIILTGGGSRTPGIAEGLSRRFTVCVEKANLLVSGGFEIDEALRRTWNAEVMDQALALAARPMGKGSGFNFRPRESAKKGYGESRSLLKKGAAALVIALILAGIEIGLDDYGARLRLAQLKGEIASEYKKIDPEATRIVDPVVQLRGKIAEAKKRTAGMGDATAAVTVLDFLKEISALAPPDLLLSSLTLEGDAVGLKGEAKNFDAVETAKKTFANSKFVKTVTIGSTNLMKQGSGVEFDLKVILKR